MNNNEENRDPFIIGKHVFGNLYGMDPNLLTNEDFLREIAIKAAELANMVIVEAKSWKFGGLKGGVSVIVLVQESHIAIHTWNEYNYATVDIYTCGEKSDPWRAFRYIIDMLKPKYYVVNYADRTQLPIFLTSEVNK
ncbi:MAG: adenosylmethionine decarboxylase [Sulfolobales archaeon]|jgi:S-adenosylmethionine decarboxylase